MASLGIASHLTAWHGTSPVAGAIPHVLDGGLDRHSLMRRQDRHSVNIRPLHFAVLSTTVSNMTQKTCGETTRQNKGRKGGEKGRREGGGKKRREGGREGCHVKDEWGRERCGAARTRPYNIQHTSHAAASTEIIVQTAV